MQSSNNVMKQTMRFMKESLKLKIQITIEPIYFDKINIYLVTAIMTFECDLIIIGSCLGSHGVVLNVVENV